jgi:hypothetical protein
MLGVDLVGSRRIWPAHVGCLVGPDGSCRIQKDRLDDQGASDTTSDGKALREARDSLETGPRIPWRVFSKLESGEQADLKQRFPGLVEDSLWQRDLLGPPSGGRPAGWQDLMPWERKLSPFD